MHALVDTGASTCVIPEKDYVRIKEQKPQHVREERDDNQQERQSLKVANGDKVPILATAEITFKLDDTTYAAKFLVVPTLITPIIGWPFFMKNDILIDCKRRILVTPHSTIQMEGAENGQLCTTTQQEAEVTTIMCLDKKITLPPGRQEVVYCKTEDNPEDFAELTGIVEPNDSYHGSKGATKYGISHILTTLDKDGGCFIMLINIDDKPRTFPKGLELAKFQVLSAQALGDTAQVHPTVAEHISTLMDGVTVSRKDFHEITRFGQDNEEEINAIDTEMEGPTNQHWFATPENTEDPSKLDEFNKRVYDLIQKCRKDEALDPTANEEMRAEFLAKFDWNSSLFNAEEKAAIEELLVKYNKIFARHRFDIGGNDEFKVKLTPAHDDPVYKKSHPTALHIKEDLKVELALLQYYGILRTLTYSKYSSPIFAQRKPNGKMRILVDLRRINHLIRHDYDENNFPLPSMEEANSHMANKKYFSKLDCSQAYHAIKMADERSVQLLAFNFESRTFAYQRLAQGLSRSATAFSSFMRKYLEHDVAADRCATFMDDVCTATKDL